MLKFNFIRRKSSSPAMFISLFFGPNKSGERKTGPECSMTGDSCQIMLHLLDSPTTSDAAAKL